ncbi:MAG TPA: type II secretion system F family protein [Actinobacteria bacterium]|nr:type II secretion system F family protein [Actinomycetota bacterium]
MKNMIILILIYFSVCLYFIYYLVRKRLLRKKDETLKDKGKEGVHQKFLNNKRFWFVRLLLFLGKTTQKVLPCFYKNKLTKKVSFIGINFTGLNIHSVLGFKILTAFSLAMLLSVIMSFSNICIVFVIGFFAGFFIPDFFVNMFVSRLNHKVENELAFAADLIYVATLAGQSIYNSIKIVTNEYKGYISNELSTFLKDLELGFGKEESYKRLLSRNNPESFKRFVFMLQQAENYGSSISEIIRQKADFSRFEISQIIDRKTRLLSTKILFPLIFLVLPSFILIVGGPLVYVIGGDLF